MKFACIRFFSLFLVLCVSICLMSSIVFASDEELSPFYFSGSLEPMSVNGATLNGYMQMLSESEFYLIGSFAGSSIYISIPTFGVDGFFPVDVDSTGSVTIPLDSSLVLGFALDSGSYYLVLFSDVLSGPFSGYIFTEKLVEDSPDLLSDLRLTGTSFLETVQGIVLTITRNPLLLLTVGIFFVGGCIAIFSRLLSKN